MKLFLLSLILHYCAIGERLPVNTSSELDLDGSSPLNEISQRNLQAQDDGDGDEFDSKSRGTGKIRDEFR